jgi:hypothetical protein
VAADPGPFRGGAVHVLAAKCATCIFWPGNLMHLSAGRVASIVDSAIRDDSAIICHSTYGPDVPSAVCRGFADGYSTSPLLLARGPPAAGREPRPGRILMHSPEVLLYGVRVRRLRRREPHPRSGVRFRRYVYLADIWHYDPRGADSGTVCGRIPRRGAARLFWGARHVRHLRVSFPLLVEVRRRLVDRCAHCRGRSTRRDPVNHRLGWDAVLRAHWWSSSSDVYHSRCAMFARSAVSCTCEEPLLLGGDAQAHYGRCALCERRATWSAISRSDPKVSAGLAWTAEVRAMFTGSDAALALARDRAAWDLWLTSHPSPWATSKR